MPSTWRWWSGFIVVVGVAIWLSAIAYREGLPVALTRIWQVDKVLHFTLAGLLAFFLDGALRRRDLKVFGLGLPLAAIFVLIPSGIDECLQALTVTRTASLWDFVADTAGVAVLIPLSRAAK